VTERVRAYQSHNVCEACEWGLCEFTRIGAHELSTLQYKRQSIPISIFRFDCPTCALCITFRAYLLWVESKDPDHQRLHAFSFTITSPIAKFVDCQKERYLDIACLKAPVVDHQEVIFVFPKVDCKDHAFLPRALEPKAELELCPERIQYCQSRHGKSCGHTDDAPEKLSPIDCDFHKIVRVASSTRYVALSYVWGPESADSIGRFPRIVQDAM
jgi:hypothetical protein